MTVLSYKGYQGEVEYEEGRLVIQVLHVRDYLTTECDAASEAEGEFHRLIDEYLEHCKAVGKEPDKPFKGSFNVRVTPELHRTCAMAAATDHMNLNQWVVRALEEYVDRSKLKLIETAYEIFSKELNVISVPLGAKSVWKTPISQARLIARHDVERISGTVSAEWIDVLSREAQN